jgi:hypothetical protein
MTRELRACFACERVIVATRADREFCSPSCRAWEWRQQIHDDQALRVAYLLAGLDDLYRARVLRTALGVALLTRLEQVASREDLPRLRHGQRVLLASLELTPASPRGSALTRRSARSRTRRTRGSRRRAG